MGSRIDQTTRRQVTDKFKIPYCEPNKNLQTYKVLLYMQATLKRPMVLSLHVLRISRDINPSPAIQNFRNLNEEVFLLGAIGSVSGKCLNSF